MDFSDIKKIAEIDLYEVLNVNQKDDVKKIKKSYKSMVLKVHPDKPNGDREVYEIVNLAYKILKNENNRRNYDQERAKYLESNISFDNLKYSNRESSTKLTKEEALKEYYFQEDILNKKHGFDSNNINPMNQSDMMKKLNELNFDRSNFVNDSKQKIKNKKLSNEDFNNNFINESSIEDNYSNEIIAFNESSNMSLVNYCGIDDFNLYSTTSCNSNNYTSLDSAFNQKLPGKIDNNYMTHNTLDDNERGRQKDRISEYNRLSSDIKSMKISDFN